jgi:predicted amidohydrolase
METLTVALWATNLEPVTVSLAAWVASVETRMAEAQAAGARLLVMPEFACGQWLAFAPIGLRIDQQVGWLATITEPALAALRPLVAFYGVALLPGTMPFAAAPASYLNRAWLLLPDGTSFAQDKICMTPSEQNPEGWALTPGITVNVSRGKA